MPKIKYENRRFQNKILKQIEKANVLLAEYEADNLSVTLRQLYYKFVSLGEIENNLRSYKNFAETVNNARLAGIIDWNSIEDRTRNLKGFWGTGTPERAIENMAYGYKENPWDIQPRYVEIWVEKDALVGVIEKAAATYRVPFFSCRGYTSQSEVWGAAERFKDEDRECLVIHLGYHDPSGKDMTRDIEYRLKLTFGVENVTVDRIALNMDQIKKYNPPPNPAKLSDSRAVDYIREFGDSSWELDALDVKIMHKMITDRIKASMDLKKWNKSLDHERENKETLIELSKRYDEVKKFLRE